jgi:2-keto-4-pentenoate hydratase/2-oxohepta-3-ene-1,7-dioic acid hydratase in catechol pathway
MRLASLLIDGREKLCLRSGNGYRPLETIDPALPATMHSFLEAGSEAWSRLRSAGTGTGPSIPVDQARYLPLVPKPGKLICLGLNYKDHAAEGGHAVPDYPAFFFRAATSLAGQSDEIEMPAVSEQLDYEVELAVVIGRTTRNARHDQALEAVAGYSVFNDGSVRDYQRKSAQWTIGKNFDRTGPLGPDLVTPDEAPPGARGLRVTTRLNGQTVQDSNTSEMIFDVETAIVLLSECLTLEPGDVIVMGTPSGVGHARRPQLWMRPGDLCECEIETIGTLRNRIGRRVSKAA